MPNSRIAIFFALAMFACGSADRPTQGAAMGGKHYGGIFNLNESEKLRAIFPLSLSQASAHRIAAQIYQGLVRLDQNDLSIKPCLAESWEKDPDATVFTFHLRHGVMFHDDPAFPEGKGRELTADDVQHCFSTLCSDLRMNQMFWLFQDRVVGANDHFAATKGGKQTGALEGVEVVDPYTVRIRLTHSTPNFLQIMAHQGCWIWPKELPSAYGDDLLAHAIGTGPFVLRSFENGEAMVLERNPAYWDLDEAGNRLPFLDGIRVTFEDDKGIELNAFLTDHLSLLFELPVDRLDVLKDSIDPGTSAVRFVVQKKAGLSTQFYGFNATRPPFNDIRVRQAFSKAIDRSHLVDSVLHGLAVAAEYGLVPPGLRSYPYGQVGKHGYDPVGARALLAEAGFPGGKGFPPLLLQTNADGFGYENVASAVQEMLLHNLGVSITVSSLPSEQHYTLMEEGRFNFWREGWIGDYPDPENFLALLYGKNAELDTSKSAFLNKTRYHNARFDSLFVQAERTNDEGMRMHLLAMAEHIAMEEAPLAPLYHTQYVRLLRSYVRDLPINAMEYRDLSAVWFDPAGRTH